MTPKEWDGTERRKANNFEREVYEFIARTDQRNQDRDLAHAVQDEVVAKHHDRICAVETFQNRVEWTVAGVPILSTVAWAMFKLGRALKGKIL